MLTPEKLSDVLWDALEDTTCGWWCNTDRGACQRVKHSVHDALLPVVEAYTDSRLEAARDEGYRTGWHDGNSADLVAVETRGRTEGARAALDALRLLADCVAKATEYGSQDDGQFIASYIIPTGPIHRAIPYLDERGINVRPGQRLCPRCDSWTWPANHLCAGRPIIADALDAAAAAVVRSFAGGTTP